jgi:hypothetical protein
LVARELKQVFKGRDHCLGSLVLDRDGPRELAKDGDYSQIVSHTNVFLGQHLHLGEIGLPLRINSRDVRLVALVSALCGLVQ